MTFNVLAYECLSDELAVADYKLIANQGQHGGARAQQRG